MDKLLSMDSIKGIPVEYLSSKKTNYKEVESDIRKVEARVLEKYPSFKPIQKIEEGEISKETQAILKKIDEVYCLED